MGIQGEQRRCPKDGSPEGRPSHRNSLGVGKHREQGLEHEVAGVQGIWGESLEIEVG